MWSCPYQRQYSYRRTRIITSLIFYRGTRWRRWVRFASWPFYTAEESRCLFNRKSFWPQGWSGCFWGRNNFPLLRVPENQMSSLRPSHYNDCVIPVSCSFYVQNLKIDKCYYQLLHISLSAYLSAWNSRLPLDEFLLKLYLKISRKSVEKFKFLWNLIRITNTLQEELCIFMVMPLSFLHKTRNILDKTYRENQEVHLIFDNFFLIIVTFVR